MPVCIVGMHRSGTSMIARALNACGLYLGEDSDFYSHDNPLLPNSPTDNPEGYWEHLGFLTCNLDILQIITGSAIDRPPFHFPAGWVDDPRLLPVRDRALRLAEDMSVHGLWGWKDPRNSLTLPFWQRLFPDLKVVVCLRNPLEVAQSLLKRDFLDEPSGLRFWLAYHEVLADALPHSPCIVTSAQTYFYAPTAEIQRVAAFIGLDAPADAAQTVKSEHHRNLSAEFLLQRDEIPTGVREHYFALAAQAGPVYERMQQDIAYQTDLLRQVVTSLHARHRDASTRARALQEVEYRLHKERQKTAQYEEELRFLRAEYAKLAQHGRAWRWFSAFYGTPKFVAGRLRAAYHAVVPLPVRLRLRDLRRSLLRRSNDQSRS